MNLKKKYRVEVLCNKKKWYWRIVSANGNILAHSETYSRQDAAEKTARNLYLSLRDADFKVVDEKV